MLGRPVDFRSDIFSLGAVAYELLSYHQAFPGSLDDGLLQRLPGMPPTPLASVCPGLPPGLEEIVMRALAKAPLERFGDLEDMRTAIRHVRANVDPRLEVETIVIPSREKPKPPASSSERRGLLERRARQIEVHREAARAALARGDLGSASVAVDDALTLDPDDAEALTLRARVRDAASAAGFELPDTLNVTFKGTRIDTPSEATRLALRSEPERPNRTPLYAAAAVVVLAIGGGVVWLMSGNQTATPTPTETASSTSNTNAPPPATPSPSTPVVTEPAPANTGSAPAPQAPRPATPTPAATPAPTATPPATVDALATPLARINQLHQSGDVAGALADLARIGSTNDPRVATVARLVAQSAIGTMESALTAAAGQRAEDLAPTSYRAAETAQRLANAAFSRNEFVVSGTRALEASEAYRRAASEARAAAAAAAAAAKIPESSPKPVSPLSSAAATPAPANPAPPTTPRPAAIDEAGIQRALNRYRDAYREMSVKALQAVFPSLPRETSQQLDRAFRRDCKGFDVTFLNMQISPVLGDPNQANVTVRTIYTCVPRTGQSPPSEPVSDFFQLRKVGDEWSIDSRGMMDSKRIR
jgi:hypothetical protein